jgi:hypothetical protein
MSLKRFFAGAAVAGGLLVASPAGASANIMWCLGDPPAQVTSTSGTQFVVNTQVFVPFSQAHLSHHYTVTTTSAPDGSGGTLVTVHVHGPAGQSITVVASVNRAKAAVTSQASGTGDVTVVLDVPIA